MRRLFFVRMCKTSDADLSVIKRSLCGAAFIYPALFLNYLGALTGLAGEWDILEAEHTFVRAACHFSAQEIYYIFQDHAEDGSRDIKNDIVKACSSCIEKELQGFYRKPEGYRDNDAVPYLELRDKHRKVERQRHKDYQMPDQIYDIICSYIGYYCSDEIKRYDVEASFCLKLRSCGDYQLENQNYVVNYHQRAHTERHEPCKAAALVVAV